MDISIVMLAYNHERFIEQALMSVLMQETEYQYELIIGEDCSMDQTRAIIQSYEPKFHGRMKPLFRKKNLGMMNNLIDCLKHCTGKYIAFLEGDDFWTDPQKLQKQIRFLETRPEYVLVVHNWNIVDIHGNKITNGFSNKEERDYGLEELGNFQLPAQTGTLLVRNIIPDILKKYGRMIKRYAWMPIDRIAPPFMLKYGKIKIMPEIMSSYRWYLETNGTNWSSKNESAATGNYLYFFVIELGLESLCKKIDIPIDLLSQRTQEYRKARAKSKKKEHKCFYFGQVIAMLLLEPHKVNFIKAVLEDHKRRMQG